jgi:hypothetical protein
MYVSRDVSIGIIVILLLWFIGIFAFLFRLFFFLNNFIRYDRILDEFVERIGKVRRKENIEEKTRNTSYERLSLP